MDNGNIEKTIFYLNTYDAAARFDLADDEAENLFNKIESELLFLDYDVVRCEQCFTNLTDSEEREIEFKAETDYLNIMKKLNYA